MFQDPSVVLYACIARVNLKGITILADFNPENDPDIETSAIQCLQNTPPHHSSFSYTGNGRTYTYLIDNELVFFAIFDSEGINELEWGIAMLFLNRVKERFDGIVAKRKSRANEYRGFQSAADELFCEPLGLQIENSKGVKSVCISFLGLAMCVMTKKRMKVKRTSFGSDTHSECALVKQNNSKQET